MEGNPLRIFGLLGNSDLAPDTAPLDLGAGMGEVVQPAMPRSGHLVDGRFLIQGSLGQGAFGEVMRARDQSLERDVAIKFLFGRAPAVRERFRREARTTASLDHPNVLAIHEFRLDGERPYIVYELIESAKTLDEAFAVSTLPERLDLFEQALAGVAAAHAAGVIHRDLKPENVLVRSDGQVRVADFGLARTDESKLTATGAFLGTPAYMAPEQVTGGNASPASDVWSLGMILYEALYEEPWGTRFVTPQELLASICSATVRRPSGGPKAIGDLLFKRVLRKRPQDRLPDAGAFLSALREARLTKGGGAGLRTAAVFGVGLVVGGLLSLAADPAPEVSSSPAELSPVIASPAQAPSVQSTPSPTPSPSLRQELPSYGQPAYFERRRWLRFASPEDLQAEVERGDSAAMRILAYRYQKGWRIEKDLAAAGLWWERAARAGCPDSWESLAHHVRKQGLEAQAEDYHQRALREGSSFALMVEFDPRGELSEPGRRGVERLVAAGDELTAIRMATFVLKHQGVEPAKGWITAAAALGAPEGKLLRVRFELLEPKPDYAMIHRYLEAGRSAGLADAYLQSVLLLALGSGVEQDLEAAQRALEEGARLGGHPSDVAYFRIRLEVKRARSEGRVLDVQKEIDLCRRTGSAYLRGELALFLLSFTRSRKAQNREIRQLAAQLLREASSSINPRVHLRLATLIEQGEIPSPRAEQEAGEAYLRAAQRSWRRATGWGVCLLKGKGVERDIDEGVRWLKRAAEAGDKNAYRLLGIVYSQDPEVPERNDPQLALRYFREGAKLGSVDAAVGAGVLSAQLGDQAGARRYFEQAMKAGSLGGRVSFAFCLVEGRGGPAEPERALRLLEEVEPGARTPRLCRLVARCYREGLGVERDLARAKEWDLRADRLEAKPAD